MLIELLARVLEAGGDVLEIEHRDRKEWVTALRGPIGFGISCLEVDEAKLLFREMDNLRRKKQVTIAGTNYRLCFSRYESFGEWVYRIGIKQKPSNTRVQRTAVRRRA